MEINNYAFIDFLYDELYFIRPHRRNEIVTFRGIVVFVDYPGIATLPLKEKMLLNKILEAVKLQPVQVRIVNIHELRNRLSTRATIHFENCKVIFFTGTIPQLFKFQEGINKYEIAVLQNSEIMISDPLEVLDVDKNLKMQLWDQLQKMFPAS